MTISPPTSCRTPFCSGHAVPGTWSCIDCTVARASAPKAPPLRRRNHAFYNEPDWKRCTKTMKVFNPLCQELDENGTQCRNPSKVSHHILDPDDRPDLKYSPSNLVCLCHAHQNRGQRGDDGKANYAPTRWKVPFGEEIFYKHEQHDPKAPFKFWIGI